MFKVPASEIREGKEVKGIQIGKHEMKISLIHKYHDFLCKKFQGILKNNPRTNNWIYYIYIYIYTHTHTKIEWNMYNSDEIHAGSIW